MFGNVPYEFDPAAAGLEAGAQTGAAQVDFTYSHDGQSHFRRGLIRLVEKLSGQRLMQQLYLDWAKGGKRPNEPVFDAALRLLRMSPRITGQGNLAGLPKTGGLLLVANHPFGIVDGLAMGQLGMALRGNDAILTNSLLCKVPEVDPHLLPVNFSGTPAARRLTSATRRQAADLLAAGKVVAIFPAGGISTTNAPFGRHAVDAAWHPFVGRLAISPGVTTVPVHFAGQNSRWFQAASHFSYPLRVALIFHETRRRMGLPVGMTIGAAIFAEELRAMDRGDIAAFLRRRTVALAGPQGPDPDNLFIWPKRVKW